MIIFLIVTTGIMAGIYFAFSVFVMQSLAVLEPLAGARAMNAINQVIIKTLFLPLFFATTIIYAVIAIRSLIDGLSGDNYVLLLAAAVYIGGMFFVTMIANVPMNNKLQSYSNDEQQLKDYWAVYLISWVRFNHIRTVSCIFSTAALCYVL